MTLKLLWLAAACVGLANLILFLIDDGLVGETAFFACLILCVITFYDAWRRGR